MPSSDIKKLGKIVQLRPDVAVLDLEDGVPLSSKAKARSNAIQFFADNLLHQSLQHKRIEVGLRISHPNSNGNYITIETGRI